MIDRGMADEWLYAVAFDRGPRAWLEAAHLEELTEEPDAV